MYKVTDFTTYWENTHHVTVILSDEASSVGTFMVDYGRKQNDSKEAFLWNLQVVKPRRHKGIGKKMLEYAIAIAEKLSCTSLSLEWNPRDSDGWVFDWYKRNGFQVDDNGHRYGVVRMTKKLKGGSK